MSAAAQMCGEYPRLFEPPVLADGVSNPRRMLTAEYWPALARSPGGKRPAFAELKALPAPRVGVRRRCG